MTDTTVKQSLTEHESGRMIGLSNSIYIIYREMKKMKWSWAVEDLISTLDSALSENGIDAHSDLMNIRFKLYDKMREVAEKEAKQ